VRCSLRLGDSGWKVWRLWHSEIGVVIIVDKEVKRRWQSSIIGWFTPCKQWTYLNLILIDWTLASYCNSFPIKPEDDNVSTLVHLVGISACSGMKDAIKRQKDIFEGELGFLIPTTISLWSDTEGEAIIHGQHYNTASRHIDCNHWKKTCFTSSHITFRFSRHVSFTSIRSSINQANLYSAPIISLWRNTIVLKEPTWNTASPYYSQLRLLSFLRI